MKIGIDFDNTITRYDTLFHEVAQKEGFISEKWDGSGKTELRNHLRRQVDGEKNWMKLQGLVYGKYMHSAAMMPGFGNFLMSCKERNFQVYIVSHKTEYGHFDLEKISLRSEALKWMEERKIFDPGYFGINREDVFFADTREEKVNMITHLNCDWFIDDLPEVFDEKHFPVSTKKILFGLYKSKQYKDRTVLNTWGKISERILGQKTYRDIAVWAKGLLNEEIKRIEKIPGQGNSIIYRIFANKGESYALKHYPNQLIEDRPRLEIEFQTLRILYQNGFKNIPYPIKKNIDLNLGIYGWIMGKKVTQPTNNDLDQAIDFIQTLVALPREIDGQIVGNASEACLSAHELSMQIEKRFLRLQKVSMNFQDLSQFLNDVFTPLWKQLKDESISLWPKESRMKDLPRNKQTLSPSDFGFHNCLKANNGSLMFLDFEYFGWDDPVKLTADFIWHPAMNLDNELKERWKVAMTKLYSSDNCFVERLDVAMPLYGLRWALIILNEFLPGFAERRKFAGEADIYNILKSQETQLDKAKHYCDRVKTMISQTIFA